MIADPNAAILMMALGILGIYLELCRPGKVIPGVLGGIAVLVGLASLFRAQSPIWWPLALFTFVPLAALTAFLLRIALRARRNKRSPYGDFDRSRTDAVDLQR
jgi:membrane protein implicated in regulation of membrane protease activity